VVARHVADAGPSGGVGVESPDLFPVRGGCRWEVGEFGGVVGGGVTEPEGVAGVGGGHAVDAGGGRCRDVGEVVDAATSGGGEAAGQDDGFDGLHAFGGDDVAGGMAGDVGDDVGQVAGDGGLVGVFPVGVDVGGVAGGPDPGEV